ncbi:DDE family transposase [Breznakia blatticola]|uniref:DDE family transposase n=1 Tax=Breznakia blatticola TaxID=1754012 RepID=A0A4R7ZAG9_9FIRM|nr:transposase [Breznakia blatticola]TDW13945.1 DDE family transposase [Breznakia blatticola]
MNSYIKYNTYRIEKTAKFKKKIYNKNNFERNACGEYICPEGKFFHYAFETEDKRSKYYRINEYYESECDGCLVKEECTKAKGNRKITHNPVLQEFQKNAKTLLDSEDAIRFRTQRSIQVEGAFGVIEQDFGYERVQRIGLKNVRMEVLLVCLGYNLKKYHNKKHRPNILN